MITYFHSINGGKKEIMSDNLSDRIWGEIGRLDDEIEKYQVKLSMYRRHVKRLTDILKDNNIPIPDLEAEEKEIRKEQLTKELSNFKEDLADFQSSQKSYEACKNKDPQTLNEEEKWICQRFSDEKWITRHLSYVNKNIRKIEDELSKL